MLQILTMTEAKLATLTPERLRQVLDYEPATGVFRWRVTLGSKRPRGQIAGNKESSGRIYIGIDGRAYLAHRLAWFYVHGEWPAGLIDHRDTDQSNNALDNLRQATRAENAQNTRRAHRDNRTGFLGVSRSGGGRFRARLSHGDMRVISKKFETPEQAHAAYVEIKALFHPFSTLAT